MKRSEIKQALSDLTTALSVTQSELERVRTTCWDLVRSQKPVSEDVRLALEEHENFWGPEETEVWEYAFIYNRNHHLIREMRVDREIDEVRVAEEERQQREKNPELSYDPRYGWRRHDRSGSPTHHTVKAIRTGQITLPDGRKRAVFMEVEA